MTFFNKTHIQKQQFPDANKALAGRQESMDVVEEHFVNGHSLKRPFPENTQTLFLGLGCFWGAERLFWQQKGVYTTAVGYAGGYTANPTYEEVCSGLTGHTEIVMVVYDPEVITTEAVLKRFWESHDPTQGMKQGGDVGTQYRSAIYTVTAEQAEIAETTRQAFSATLAQQGFPEITTEIRDAPTFYYAETYHQQYLAKNPEGYCGLKGTGVCLGV